MIILFHTPKGQVRIDSKIVTDRQLSKIGLSRYRFNRVLEEQPRDLAGEVGELKAQLRAKNIL